jgi:uncharacterized membrane protein YphA (DoxX/SURF4 family)
MNKNTILVARVLMGLVFTVFGLNGFFHFMPMPKPTPAAGMFFMAMFKTGYMLPMLFTTQLVTGVMLLLDFYTPLALILLTPVIVNIFLFHVCLDPQGGLIGYIATALQVFLLFAYLASFKGILTKKVKIK